MNILSWTYFTGSPVQIPAAVCDCVYHSLNGGDTDDDHHRVSTQNPTCSHVDQHPSTWRAFYLAMERDAASLAMLAAERPNLRELVQFEEKDHIGKQKITLQRGTDLELIASCQ